MKKSIIFLSVVFFALWSNSCMAGDFYGTSSNIGGTTYHHYNDGTSGTSSNIGGTTYHNFSD